MESIMDYLDMLEDVLDNSKNVPFSTKVSVEKEKLFDIINEMRMNIPNEVRQAQRIIEDHDKIINEAKNKASAIIKEASIQAHDLADEHEIYKLAMEQAQELMEDAKKNSREMRLNSMDYADEILLQTETSIREALSSLDKYYREIEDDFIKTINILYSNRQELRGNKG